MPLIASTTDEQASTISWLPKVDSATTASIMQKIKTMYHPRDVQQLLVDALFSMSSSFPVNHVARIASI